ncbi:DNA mismatch repair protein msh2 [Nosema bombycis CQ1]|uniref:DNA mismatch repair protein msh2 n=1 Tax=Nosema bombycis (strain CQ1 / CVCC 102059) TaxID=578461 RepID=R0KMX2_NOSB1|nr:DNA mismatch repair protein msh2 [Nosema bombycis CQ1]|eukprot:EOB11482.1 DNA mismatch repair protein msh2 [Nosema bombycis CQ1]
MRCNKISFLFMQFCFFFVYAIWFLHLPLLLHLPPSTLPPPIIPTYPSFTMNDSFYSSLDPNSFKYFLKDGFYFVYKDDLRFIKGSGHKVDILILENAIKDALTIHKVKVQEYSFLNNEFILSKEGYPGNWKDFTDILLDKNIPPSICSITINKNHIYISFLNTLNNTIFTSNFEDDDIFSNLCGFLSEINAFEIIYCDLELKPILKSLGILSHYYHGGDINNKQDSNKDNQSNNSSINNSTFLLINFLKISSPLIQSYNRPNICRVDKEVLESLNLINNNNLNILNTFNCFTNQGHRLLLNFIKNPLKSKDEIEYRLRIVDEFINLDFSILKTFPDLLRLTKRIQNYKITIQEIVRLYQVIKKVPEIMGVLIKNRDDDGGNSGYMDANGNMDAKEDFNGNTPIYNPSSLSHPIFTPTFTTPTLPHNSIIFRDFYTPLLNLSSILNQILLKIEENVDLDSKFIFRMKIKDQGLRDCYDLVQFKIKEEFDKIKIINKNIKYDESINLFKISRIEYQKSEEQMSNFLILNVLKTGIQFTTKTLSELNLEREKVLEKIKKEEREELENLKEFIKERNSEIEVLNYLIGLIDVFNSFSIKAKTPGYSRPEFIGDVYWDMEGRGDMDGRDEGGIEGRDEGGMEDRGKDEGSKEGTLDLDRPNLDTPSLDLKDDPSLKPNLNKPNLDKDTPTSLITPTLENFFNPLLENTLYIPNDLILDKKMLILTGPNMGGKSTLLKSIGVISILGQMGCYVPASKALLPIYNGIFTRMGASDCTYTGDSTFMLEMKDLSKIMRNHNRSLILIDELGRGTSEVDGLSLCLSVKDFLLKKDCITLFATHFPELCEDKRILKKRIKTEGTLLLYKIEEGICDESFGMNVAKRVGFPDDVLDEINRRV